MHDLTLSLWSLIKHALFNTEFNLWSLKNIYDLTLSLWSAKNIHYFTLSLLSLIRHMESYKTYMI